MLSHLELRQVIESAFLPVLCVCSIRADNSMIVQLIDPLTRLEKLTIIGGDSTTLTSSRAISVFVNEVKDEARMGLRSPEKLRRLA